MAVLQMTRAEYEKKYGVAPATPTIQKMTRAEYEVKYGLAPEPKKPNYFQRVGEGFAEIGEDIVSGIQEGAQALQTGTAKKTLGGKLEAVGGLVRAGLRTVGGVARGAFTPILEAPIIKQATEAIVGRVAELPGAEDLIRSATDLAIKYPNASKDLRDIVDIVSLGVGGALEKPALKEAQAIGQDISAGTRALLTPSEEAIQNKVLALFQKSIKPKAKGTLAQGERYNADTLNALRTIKANVEKLNIEDATGELIAGRTPQTINELAQGLDQTKKIVFSQYDDLAKKAGTAGATIDAKAIADEVAQVANNRALQLANPAIIDYAKGWEERLRGFDVLDAETTQEVIKLMNTDLQAFYRNPTFDSASKATINAGIANNFRQALDKAIEGATGEQYQVLKQQYAALKAIENDVVRASMREAKKNTKGLLDYTDIFTGGQMIGGLLSLNPAMFTKGAIERGFKEYIKFLNDPNRAISNIFEKLNIDTTKTFEPISATGKSIKENLANPSLGLSIKDVSGISKELQPLAAEARKYKTAEEFVKAQTPVYHGSPTELKQFHNKNGVFFTDNYPDATGFAGSPDNVYEGYLNFKKPLTIDAKGAKWDELNTKYGKSTTEVVGNAQKAGFDGVVFKNIVDNIGDTADYGGESTISFAFKPKDAFLNESQLTDFYNKVTGKKK